MTAVEPSSVGPCHQVRLTVPVQLARVRPEASRLVVSPAQIVRSEGDATAVRVQVLVTSMVTDWVATMLPSLKQSVMDKTRRLLEARPPRPACEALDRVKPRHARRGIDDRLNDRAEWLGQCGAQQAHGLPPPVGYRGY